MNKHPKVIFADTDEEIEVSGYSVSEKLVSICCDNPRENLSGFSIYEGERLIFDASGFIYRWDVVDQKENVIYYTNDPNYRQTEPWPDLSDIPEQAEPLTNEELTEAVADLMYEISAAQLGL